MQITTRNRTVILCAVVLSILLCQTLPARQVPTSSSVTKRDKEDFIALVSKLPHKGDFFTTEAVQQAEPYLPVLFALDESDLDKADVFPYVSLSKSLSRRAQNREFAQRHFRNIKHPVLQVSWAAMLMNENATSTEVRRFLRKALSSPSQTTVLMDLLGPEFQGFKQRVLTKCAQDTC